MIVKLLVFWKICYAYFVYESNRVLYFGGGGFCFYGKILNYESDYLFFVIKIYYCCLVIFIRSIMGYMYIVFLLYIYIFFYVS